jgi:lysophospholipase L1-like esterase
MAKQKCEASDYWKSQVEVFEEMTRYVKPDPVVVLGDSITQAFRIGEFIPEHYFLNRGIDGDTTVGVLHRLKSSVYELNPVKLFILIGTNDLPTLTNEQILQNYKDIILKIISKSSECEIFVISILPTNSWIDRPNKRINELNIKLEALAKKFEINYLNAFPLFCDEKNQLRQELTTDGLHLSPAGYNILAKLIKNCLK